MRINIKDVWGKGYIEQLELEDDDFIVNAKGKIDDNYNYVVIETTVSVRPEVFDEIEEAHTAIKNDDGESVRPEWRMQDFLESCKSPWIRPNSIVSYSERVSFKGISKSNTEKRNEKLRAVYKEKIADRDANFERDVEMGKEKIRIQFNHVVEKDKEEFSDRINQNLKSNKDWSYMADERIKEDGDNGYLEEYADIQRQIDELEESRDRLRKQIGEQRKEAFTKIFTDNDFPESLKEEVTEILKEADPNRYLTSDLKGRIGLW